MLHKLDINLTDCFGKQGHLRQVVLNNIEYSKNIEYLEAFRGVPTGYTSNVQTITLL